MFKQILTISIFIRLGWILFWPDTWYQLIFHAGYLANVRYPANYRLSSIKNQPDIRYPDSFNIQFPAGYWNCRISGPTLIFINIYFLAAAANIKHINLREYFTMMWEKAVMLKSAQVIILYLSILLAFYRNTIANGLCRPYAFKIK